MFKKVIFTENGLTEKGVFSQKLPFGINRPLATYVRFTFYFSGMSDTSGFLLKTADGQIIRFNFYEEAAPITCKAFASLLPFARTFFHARVSGQEIWVDNAHEIDIIQENASVFTEPGEIVLGPLKPLRNKVPKCIGIYYGEGKGLDAGNIFGKVWEEDLPKLKLLGEKIWKEGAQELAFEKMP